jgi:hypothetical protein
MTKLSIGHLSFPSWLERLGQNNIAGFDMMMGASRELEIKTNIQQVLYVAPTI